MSSVQRTLYAVLGVAPDAPPKVIKAAYRALAKQYHPDGEGLEFRGATDKFIELQEAYKILSGAESRAEYDRSIMESNSAELHEEPEEEARIDPDEIWAVKARTHPEINDLHVSLAILSPQLGNRFRLGVTNGECDDNPAAFAAELDAAFLKKYFGLHPEVQALARRLLVAQQRPAARALNRAVQSGRAAGPAQLASLVAEFEQFLAPTALKGEAQTQDNSDGKKRDIHASKKVHFSRTFDPREVTGTGHRRRNYTQLSLFFLGFLVLALASSYFLTSRSEEPTDTPDQGRTLTTPEAPQTTIADKGSLMPDTLPEKTTPLSDETKKKQVYDRIVGDREVPGHE